MLNLKEGLFIAIIGILALFSTGCEKVSFPVGIPVGIDSSFLNESERNRREHIDERVIVTGIVVQVFSHINEIWVKVEEHEELVFVLLKDNYSQDELDNLKGDPKVFAGYLTIVEENRLTISEAELLSNK